MIIHGIQITEAQEAAMLAVTRAGPFSAQNLVYAAVAAGVPQIKPDEPAYRQTPIAYRAADRLLQRERKAGRIEQRKGSRLWFPVKANPASD